MVEINAILLKAWPHFFLAQEKCARPLLYYLVVQYEFYRRTETMKDTSLQSEKFAIYYLHSCRFFINGSRKTGSFAQSLFLSCSMYLCVSPRYFLLFSNLFTRLFKCAIHSHQPLLIMFSFTSPHHNLPT